MSHSKHSTYFLWSSDATTRPGRLRRPAFPQPSCDPPHKNARHPSTVSCKLKRSCVQPKLGTHFDAERGKFRANQGWRQVMVTLQNTSTNSEVTVFWRVWSRRRRRVRLTEPEVQQYWHGLALENPVSQFNREGFGVITATLPLGTPPTSPKTSILVLPPFS
jgi:hypothetical protein